MSSREELSNLTVHLFSSCTILGICNPLRNNSQRMGLSAIATNTCGPSPTVVLCTTKSSVLPLHSFFGEHATSTRAVANIRYFIFDFMWNTLHLKCRLCSEGEPSDHYIVPDTGNTHSKQVRLHKTRKCTSCYSLFASVRCKTTKNFVGVFLFIQLPKLNPFESDLTISHGATFRITIKYINSFFFKLPRKSQS